MRLAHDGWPALFLSQEMEDADLAGRGVASLGQIDYGRIQTGRLDRDDWERLTDAAQKASRLGFYIDDQPALRPTDISIKASMVRGLKVLIVDYIQLTEAGSDRDTRNRQIEIVTRHLKRMAKEMGIAVIALSQLNRSIEQRANAQPVLSDLRESGAIEQDMDVVMFLWEVKQADVHGDSIIGCSVAKNRHGRRGRFALRFHGATQSWGESTYDLEAQASAAGSGRI
jgi:replicative DNA helicase